VILHRLRLTNFRGVENRELSFPDRGVVVVCGPNEIGKSSMLEALDLLLQRKQPEQLDDDRAASAPALEILHVLRRPHPAKHSALSQHGTTEESP
jgi:recombinational DNA repair ATPase RecF